MICLPSIPCIGAPKRARSTQDPRSGWTLAEMMVAVGIGSLILMAVMQTSLFTSRSFAALGNYCDLDQASRNALDRMSRDIREARVYGDYAANGMSFTNMDNTWFSYTWDPTHKTVTRVWGTVSPKATTSSTVVLTGCDYFSFRIWQRNPTNQFWFPYSAMADPHVTKLVDVSWKCSRRVLNQFNTESVQTAKIVLRN